MNLNGWIVSQPNQPYRYPCVVVPNPDDFKYCGRPSGDHTALGFPVCDDCYAAVSDPSIRPEYGPIRILGGIA